MGKKIIKIMDVSFRDGFQSVFGARVLTKDFMPAVEAAKEAGITHFEAGGGARFQSLYFYCNEDAFDMMDTFRKVAGKDANLQTLARGVNVVALDSQPKDMIKLHADLFKKHGMTTIRNFDALNDVNNLIYSGQCIVDAGLKHEVTVTMMGLPLGCEGAHNPEFYKGVLRQILDAKIPFNSVCFKDASGTSTPATVYETIKMAKAMLPEGVDVRFHTHETAGTSALCHKAALDAGVDGLDLAMAPVSGGTSHIDIVSMWHGLRGTEYDLGVDIEKILVAEEVFKDCLKDYFFPPEALKVEPLIPFSPMPGGALTANTQMLRDNGIMNKYQDVIKAMGEVVKRGGYGTSVTPVSQFYFQQAFNNVMFGDWKKIADGYGKMVLGYFGKTPVAPDPEIIKIAQEQLKLNPTTENPTDMDDKNPKKGIAFAKKRLEEEGLATTDENIFIFGSCEDKGIDFLKGKAKVMVRKVEAEKPKVVEEAKKAKETKNEFTVKLNNEEYFVVLDGNKATVNDEEFEFDVKDGIVKTEKSADKKIESGAGTVIKAALPGVVIKLLVKVGDNVKNGQTILVIESMKMEVPILSNVNGKVAKLKVSQGDKVESDQELVVIG